MDGYCTLAKVEAAMPSYSFSATSRPTRVQAAIHIRTIFHSINGILDNLGYLTPVPSTNPTAIRVLGHLNMLGAASMVQGAAYSVNRDLSEYKSKLMERYEIELKVLEKGQKALLDAARGDDYTPRVDEVKPAFEMDVSSNGVDEEAPQIDLDTEF
jgi:hypothetical protein